MPATEIIETVVVGRESVRAELLRLAYAVVDP
jgi:hypothetical protein